LTANTCSCFDVDEIRSRLGRRNVPLMWHIGVKEVKGCGCSSKTAA